MLLKMMTVSKLTVSFISGEMWPLIAVDGDIIM